MSDLNSYAAYDKCIKLAHSHYENFPVARLVPKRIRKHVAAVYAFARTADDIADEEHDKIASDDPIRVKRLAEFESQLDIKNPKDLAHEWNWIFIALSQTIKEFDIPKQLFRDLVSAFAQDVIKKRYTDFADLLDYCRRSANPVGRLVLILHGLRDEKLFRMSDSICTALQLANFWQDMSVDRLKNRIYIPQSDWTNLTENDFFAKSASKEVRDIVEFQCKRTSHLFNEGSALPNYLPFPLNIEIRLTLYGGRAIIEKIKSQHFDTLSKRPKIGKKDKFMALIRAIFAL